MEEFDKFQGDQSTDVNNDSHQKTNKDQVKQKMKEA